MRHSILPYVLSAGSLLAMVAGSMIPAPGAAAERAQDAPSADLAARREQCVRDYIAAFNARDLDALLAMVAEDVQWLSVDGAKIAVEAQGKAQLGESLASYFRSCASCRSELEWVQLAGRRLTALERASWTAAQGPAVQQSLSVYEFEADRIARVYYFPAEPAPSRAPR